MLRLEHISKTFGTTPILRDVSLDVERGHIAILLGASGAGKSTLLRILNNLETLDAGTITLDGKPLALAALSSTHTVGMVFQNFNLFDHLTVIQNITLPLEKVMGKSPQEAHDIAMHLLKKYGLDAKADAYISQLSGGQKQRLAIARTLALKPQILCMDEPTSALDPLLTTSIAQTIQSLADEKYIVLVTTHDISLVERLDGTIYLMDQGKIIESASSKKFAENKNAFPRIRAFVAGAAHQGE